MEYENKVVLTMDANSKNEAYARVAAAAFFAQLDSTVSDLTDIKTAVSEAVTNSIIHGYDGKPTGEVHMLCAYKDGVAYIEIWDDGAGIDDIERARKPLFTSKPEMERSGMGFTIMESFMDRVEVFSGVNQGTRVVMTRKISPN